VFNEAKNEHRSLKQGEKGNTKCKKKHGILTILIVEIIATTV
jgi:hypothetical protein